MYTTYLFFIIPIIGPNSNIEKWKIDVKDKLKTIQCKYCEIISFCGHQISWFDDIGHVRGHLNSWISNYMH